MDDQEIIKIVQAHIDGEEIEQWYKRGGKKWLPFSGVWKFNVYIYRVKPKPLEFWINLLGNTYQIYPDKEAAWEAMNPHNRYDAIGVHMKEVLPEKEDE